MRLSALTKRFGRVLWVLSALIVLLTSRPAVAGGVFVHVHLDGVINPVKARLLSRAAERARSERAEFLLVTIDTPGGLVVSMEEIVTTLTNAGLPVVSFVQPRSAQATSAGAFVLLAADLAAMAPGTRLGAAHPVANGKPLEGALDDKATSTLSALIKSLAERKGRPTDLAEAMVQKSTSYTAEEAQEKKLIELIANDEAELLRKLDGREVKPGRKLATRGLQRLDVPLSRVEKLLDQLADPTLTSLLLSIGVLAIMYELSSPGIGVGGVVGATLLVLGLLGSSVLALETTALVLFLIGFVAIALEVKLPTHGVLAGAGVLALVLGAALMVDPGDYFGGINRVRLTIFLPVLATFGLGLFFLARLVRTAQNARAETGIESMIGRHGSARSSFGTALAARDGLVHLDGALWRAETEDNEIREGDPVEVLAVKTHPTRVQVRRRPVSLPFDSAV